MSAHWSIKSSVRRTLPSILHILPQQIPSSSCHFPVLQSQMELEARCRHSTAAVGGTIYSSARAAYISLWNKTALEIKSPAAGQADIVILLSVLAELEKLC